MILSIAQWEEIAIFFVFGLHGGDNFTCVTMKLIPDLKHVCEFLQGRVHKQIYKFIDLYKLIYKAILIMIYLLSDEGFIKLDYSEQEENVTDTIWQIGFVAT